MTDTESKAWFGGARESGFGEWTDADDLLHSLPSDNGLGDGLAETHFFSWNVPEERIKGVGMLWHRPNLKVASGGIWVWQGIKKHNLTCEIYDWNEFTGDEVLANDLHDYTFPNSYRVQTLKPFAEHHISYSDPSRENSVDVHFDAIMSPVVPAQGKNFEQPVRTSGTVTLRGRTYQVNGTAFRDRHWHQVRSQASPPGPPISWTNGWFEGGDLFFCLTATDTPSTGPEWRDWAPTTDQDALRGGWIHRDGKTLAITAVRKLTRRDPTTLFPQGCELQLIDSDGGEHNLTGRVTAAANVRAWHNGDVVICHMEWSHDGRSGHGDFQDVMGADFIREFM